MKNYGKPLITWFEESKGLYFCTWCLPLGVCGTGSGSTKEIAENNAREIAEARRCTMH